MFTEARLLLERVAGRPRPQPTARARRRSTAPSRPPPTPSARPAPGSPRCRTPSSTPCCRAHPLRELVTVEGPYPAYADRAARAVRQLVRVLPALRGRHRATRRPARSPAAPSAPPPSASTRSPTMGFDVIYLPPIHPIGEVNRKGPNNTLTPGPDDTGSPWAIGSKDGGHDAIHPDLGHVRGLRRLRGPRPRARPRGGARPGAAGRARPPVGRPATRSGSPPAPTAPSPTPRTRRRSTRTSTRSTSTTTRPASAARCCGSSGSGCRTACGSSASTTRTPSRWRSGSGCSREVRRTDPDVLFLAEAFTRPAMMQRPRRDRLPPVLHLLHLAHRQVGDRGLPPRAVATETDHLMRPNFFVNTPDILHAYLQYGGPAAFKIRAALAATGSPELGRLRRLRALRARRGQARAARSTSTRRSTRSGSATGTPPSAEGRTLAPYLTRLNEIRRAHPALQLLRNVHHPPQRRRERPGVLQARATGRRRRRRHRRRQPRPARAPARRWSTSTCRPSACDWHDSFVVHDEITGEDWSWGQHNYVRLDPSYEPAHILTVRRTR